MRMLFKTLGLVAVLTVCTAMGFLKAASLKARFCSLCEIKNGLLKLKERLRLHGGDKKRLINECYFTQHALLQNLSRDDKNLLNEFLSEFGKGDTRQEFERCEAFIALFDARIGDAKAEFDGQHKLYKSLGFLSGVFICIFFL